MTAVPVRSGCRNRDPRLASADPRALLEKRSEAPADPPAAKDGASPPPTPAVAPAPDPPQPTPLQSGEVARRWAHRDVPAPPKAPVRPAKGGQPVQGQLYGRFTKK